jgi:hypothetical protein
VDEDFDTYEAPAEAARGDIPEQFTRVVWTEIRGDRAVVLLRVSANPPYVDLSRCERGPRGWYGGVSGNASSDERPDDFAHWLATAEFEE